MIWLLLGTSLVLLWTASLCKVLFFSHSLLMNPVFHASGKKKNVLLVIAHPDDESMFFSPTLQFLASEGDNVHILCISAGDADGKGSIRKEELKQVCIVLKIPLQNVRILEHENLQDGFDKEWDHQLLATIIAEHVRIWDIQLLITFDRNGISAHPNHCDVHHGTRKFLADNAEQSIEAWELCTTNILRKYAGPVDIWLSIIKILYVTRGKSVCLVNCDIQKSFLAMSKHDSQWVWFRKLFVLFSSYSYMNTLRRISA